MRRDVFREIQKRETMQFVYAAFYKDGDDVYIKLGRSGTPYKRVLHVSNSCPFVLARAVFSCVGSIKLAEAIEASAKFHFASQRMRGEWYRFSKTDGQLFSSVLKNIYAKVTGRPLKWSTIQVAEIKADMEAGFARKIGIASADKAA